MSQTIQSANQEPITSELLAKEPELFVLVARFIKQLPEQLTDIDHALEKQNWAELKHKMHDLKGLGGNFGFPELSRVARQIDDEMTAQTYANIPPLLQALKSLYQRIRLGQNNQQAE